MKEFREIHQMGVSLSGLADFRTARLLRKIVDDSINAVKPSTLFDGGISVTDEAFVAFGRRFELDGNDRFRCIAIGKAAEAMAFEVERKLGEKVTGIVATPVGRHLSLNKFKFFKTGHPFPDVKSLDAAKEIISFVQTSGSRDFLIFLVSGGGSSSAFMPVAGLSLADIRETLKVLFDGGVPISKVNLLRRHLSALGGGKMAALAPESRKITLIISDVVGDDPSSIASGPTVEDFTSPQDSVEFLRENGLLDRIPARVCDALTELGNRFTKISLKNNSVELIADNAKALAAAEKAGIEAGYNTIVLTRFVEMTTKSVADLLVSIARSLVVGGKTTPTLVILGGETTLKMSGDGKGGRNQHLALQALGLLVELLADGCEIKNTTLFSYGTDGKDGNSDAAGAYVSLDTLKNIIPHSHEIEDHISRCDSNSFFEKHGGLITTGPTDTNVMDVMGIITD